MTLEVNGELWVPVEITLIGKTGFMEAWRKGVEEWTALSRSRQAGILRDAGGMGAVSTRGLKEIDLGLQYGRKERHRRGLPKGPGKRWS